MGLSTRLNFLSHTLQFRCAETGTEGVEKLLMQARNQWLGRGGCVLLVSALSVPAFGQTAYFSLEGDINAVGDQYDFTFDLTRSVGSSEVLRFENFASSGGTNSAGDIIALGGMDSELELFDIGDISRGYNDDAISFDAKLSWAGVFAGEDTPLNPDPLAADSYRLHLNEFSNNQIGAFALDMVGPADAMTVTGASPVGTGTLRSLKFGTDLPTGAAATFNQSTTLTISDNLTIAQTGQAVFNNSGSTTVQGTTDLNSGGTLTQTAGILYTDTVNLNGGALDIQGGVWSVNTLTGLTTLDIDGFMVIGDVTAGSSAASLTVGSGQSLDVQGTFSVGEVGKAGTLTVNNGGVVTAGSTARIGGFGGTNGSSITVGPDGMFDVGGDLRVGGSFAGAGGTSMLTIDGFNAIATTEVGGDVTVFGGSTVSLLNNGRLNVDGSVNVTGAIDVSGVSRFVTKGVLDIKTGGSVSVQDFAGIYADTLALSGGTFSTPLVNGLLSINRMQDFGSLSVSYLLSIGETVAGDSTSSVIVGNGEAIDSDQYLYIGSNKPGHLTINNGGRVTVDTLAQIGSGSGSAGSTVNVNAGGLFDLPGSLAVGGDIFNIQPGTLTIDGAAAEVEVDGTLTIRTGSTVTASNGGILDANGGINVEGGTLNLDIPTFQWAGGNTMTVSDGGQVSASGGQWDIFGGNTVNVTDGNLTHNGTFIVVGNGTEGTVNINGADASMNILSFHTDVSGGGATGTLNFLNGATGTVNQLNIARSNTTATTDGTLNILSGSSLNTDHITVGNLIGNLGTGTINLAGSGSSITNVGGSGITLGNVNPLELISDHTLNVSDNATYTTGNGVSRIEKTGTLNILTNGVFNVKGTLNLNDRGTLMVNSGGQLNIDVAALNIASTATFDASGGTVFVNNNGSFNGASLLSASFGTLRVENDGTANLPAATTVDTLIQDDGFLNTPASASSSFVVNDVQDFDAATFEGTFTLGSTAAGPSAGSMILGTGDTLTVKGSATVGLDKAASLSVNDGTFNADGGLLLGFEFAGGGLSGSGPGTVTVNAGTLNVKESIATTVGLNIGGVPLLGNNTGNALVLNDGQINVDGTTYVAPSNSFTMVDGELDTSTLINSGTLNITDGNVKVNAWINGSLTSFAFGVFDMGAASLTLGTTRNSASNPIPAEMVIRTGESLSASSVDVGVEVDATLNILDGGVVTTTASSDVGDNSLNGSTGTVNITGAGSVWNAGGGGGLDIVRGTLNVSAGGSVVTTSATGSIDVFEDGVLRGNGTLTANGEVYNEGAIILESVVDGPVIRDMQVLGNYTQDTDGKIEIGVVTGADTLLEQLIVLNGLMTLAGELTFDPLADFSNLPLYNSGIGPALNGQGTSTITGVFDTVTGGADLGDGTGLALTYNPGDVEIQRAILGDLNLDGYVGIDDLNAVLAVWNQNVDAGVWSLGDPSGDGFVGIDDLGAVLANWNNGTPPPPIGQASIPEPATLMLLCVGGLAAMRRR